MALKNCRECGKEVSSKASTCPHCGYKLKKKLGCFSWIAIIFIIVVIITIIEVMTRSTSSDRDYTSERTAYNLSKDYAKQNLKSPSTASYPGLFESKDHVKDLGNGRYQINSWVDSQNGFGATIRTKFSCVMVKKSGDRWGIENLKFNE